MTNLQEAKLAREAELCYVTVAMVTDYDCWHPHHDSVTVDQIVAVLLKNAENATGSSAKPWLPCRRVVPASAARLWRMLFLPSLARFPRLRARN